jgi:hypothetical protein
MALASIPPLPLKGGQLVLATIALALATFMTVLNTSIANVAIPNISGALDVSVDEGTWVITVFAAANAVSIPLTGWLTQRIGQVKLFIGAILLFVVSSWLCGIAPRCAHHRDVGVDRLRNRVLYALEICGRDRYVAFSAADTSARHSDGSILRATHRNYPVWAAATTNPSCRRALKLCESVLRRSRQFLGWQRME